MNATLETFNAANYPASPAASTKSLWAAVGVLGVCVVAMGGALVHVSSGKLPDAAVSSAVSGNAPALATPMQSLSSGLMPLTAPAGLLAPVPAQEKSNIEKKPADASVKSPPVATKSGANTGTVEKRNAPVLVASSDAGTAPVPQPASHATVQALPAPAPSPVLVAQPVAKPICASCGVVETVTPIVRKGEPGAVGAIAGGVLGAVIGNQVGQGTGKTVATVLGGVGGVLAGREIEKNVKKTTVYNVQVRMEDGSLRSFEQASSLAVGAKVTVEAGSLRAE